MELDGPMLFHLIFQFKYGFLHVFNLRIALRRFLLQFQAGSVQLLCLTITYLLQVRILLFHLERKEGFAVSVMGKRSLHVSLRLIHAQQGKLWACAAPDIASLFLASETAKAINVEK